MPTLGPLIPLTPSPSARNRPQSFAQKLKSTSKSVKGKLGYTNLNESVSTPMKKSPNASHTTFDPSGFALQKSASEHKNSIAGVSSTFGDYVNPRASFSNIVPPPHILSDIPVCWKTMYHLLDLYATMPETKTVSQRIAVSPDAQDPNKATKKPLNSNSVADDEDVLRTGTPIPLRVEPVASAAVVPTQSSERTRFTVFGVVNIQTTRLLATLSGLKLEAEISGLQSSATWKKKCRPAAVEYSHTGHVGSAMIVLLEGVAPGQQTVVKVTIGKSQILYSSFSRRGRDRNSGLLSIGAVNIDIPQHPVALHGMMTRSSKQLSSTLQELRVARTSTRLSRQNEEPDSPLHARSSETAKDRNSGGSNTAPKRPATLPPKPSAAPSVHPSALLQPLVMQFQILLNSLSVNAALLPSLQAQYKMDTVKSSGVSGSNAKFTIELPNHSLSFTTKIQATEANLPKDAYIALPVINVAAEYIQENASQDIPIDGVVLRQGGYVSASANIGDFERCLTTDLLNHLVFVQKVFMRVSLFLVCIKSSVIN